jgi:hypothetical protein
LAKFFNHYTVYISLAESFFCIISNLITLVRGQQMGFFTKKGDNGALLTSINVANPNVVTATRLAEHLFEFEIGYRVYDEGLSPPC